MKKIKVNIQCFRDQDLQDIWSALKFWLDQLDKKQNPKTAKDVERLIKRVRKYLK